MAPTPVQRGHPRTAAATGLTLLAVLLPASIGVRAAAQDVVDPSAPPQVTDFVFTPSVLSVGHKGAFRFTTSREGAGDIVLVRLASGHRVGRLRFAVDPGEAKKSFDARINGRRLPRGRYRATLHVINADVGASAASRVTLRLK